MSERNYWVLCDDNCRFPAMTKEQIIAAIAEATGETPVHIDDAFITKIKEQNRQDALRFWIGSRAEYNAISEKEDDVLYIVTGETELDVLQAQIEELQRQITPLIVTCTLNRNAAVGYPVIENPSAEYQEIVDAAVAGRTVTLRVCYENDAYTFYDYRLTQFATAFVSAENSRVWFMSDVVDTVGEGAEPAVIWVDVNNNWTYTLLDNK